MPREVSRVDVAEVEIILALVSPQSVCERTGCWPHDWRHRIGCQYLVVLPKCVFLPSLLAPIDYSQLVG